MGFGSDDFFNSCRFEAGEWRCWCFHSGVYFVHFPIMDVDEADLIRDVVELERNFEEFQIKYRYAIVVLMWNGFASCVQP